MDTLDSIAAERIMELLDRGTLLSLRATCYMWASYFESLCKDQHIICRLGRPLGGRLIHYAVPRLVRRDNFPLYLNAVRGQLSLAESPREKISALSFVYMLEIMNREEVDHLVGGDLDELLAAAPDARHVSRYLVSLLRDETLEKLAAANPLYRDAAYDRGLPLWSLYSGINYLRCPAELPPERHREFLAQLTQRANIPLVDWDLVCPGCQPFVESLLCCDYKFDAPSPRVSMDVFDVAYYIAPHLDAGSWLALRAVNRAWAGYFEALCAVPELMMAFGRVLGGKPALIDPMRFEHNPINAPLFAQVVREHLRNIPREKRLQRLYRIPRFVRLNREQMDAALGGSCREFISDAAARGCKFMHAAQLWLSDEDIVWLARRHPGDFLGIAYARGLPMWHAYKKALARYHIYVHCPRIPAAQHADFLWRLLCVVDTECYIDWSKICAPCIPRILGAAYRVWSAPSIAHCLEVIIHRCPISTLDVFAECVLRSNEKEVYISEDALSGAHAYRYISRLYEREPRLVDTQYNRTTFQESKESAGWELLDLLDGVYGLSIFADKDE